MISYANKKLPGRSESMFAGAGVILILLAIICVLAAYFVIKTDRKLWIVIGVICLLLILFEAAVLWIMRQ